MFALGAIVISRWVGSRRTAPEAVFAAASARVDEVGITALDDFVVAWS
jgi:hypothetical protein